MGYADEVPQGHANERSNMKHDGYKVESHRIFPVRVRARCACGWTSEYLPNGGLAGAAWDDHKEKNP